MTPLLAGFVALGLACAASAQPSRRAPSTGPSARAETLAALGSPIVPSASEARNAAPEGAGAADAAPASVDATLAAAVSPVRAESAPADAPAGEPAQERRRERQRLVDAEGRRIAAALTRGGPDWTFPGWDAQTFVSGHQAAAIHYQTQKGAEGGPATVFVGGVGLAESFDSLFATDSAPRHDRLFLVLRGNDPSPWVRTPDIFDADAHDLARAVALAGERSGASGVHLAAHSYSTLALQRMIQRRDDAEIKKGLETLRGGQVTLVTGATLYDGHHVVAGDQYETLMSMLKNAVAQLDAVEAAESETKLIGGLFPFWNPLNLGLNVWSMTRDLLLSESTMGVSKNAEEFSEPWAPEIDHIRRYLKQRRVENAGKHDWQEALLRRTVATSSMNFTPEDAAAIRALGLRVDVVYAHDDQLIPWTIGQLLPRRLGIDAPAGDAPPAPGTVLSDPSGLFRLHVVAGDHYFPLKHPAGLKRILDGHRADGRQSAW